MVMSDNKKLCKRCGIIKLAEFFNKSKTSKDKLKTTCINCMTNQDNAHYFCNSCKTLKPHTTEFFSIRKTKNGETKLRTQCKDCSCVTSKSSHFKNSYKITVEQLEILKLQQEFCCKICNKKTDLVVDHNHRTGDVRSLICNNCNLGLGMFQDNIDLIKKAIQYLKIENNE